LIIVIRPNIALLYYFDLCTKTKKKENGLKERGNLMCISKPQEESYLSILKLLRKAVKQNFFPHLIFEEFPIFHLPIFSN